MRGGLAYVEVPAEPLPVGERLPPGCQLLLIPAREAAASWQAREYKTICDILLPALRPRAHLFNLIFRHRSNHSLVLMENGAVIGGSTFRVVRDTRSGQSPRLIVEVVLLAMAQREGVCGRGFGTRLVNFLKALALREAAMINARPLLLTQADIGLQARQFWLRQLLQECDEATEVVHELHRWHKSNIVYDYTVPMVCEIDSTTAVCVPRESERAKQLDEEGDDLATGGCAACSRCQRQVIVYPLPPSPRRLCTVMYPALTPTTRLLPA